jgi:hypothetical protein
LAVRLSKFSTTGSKFLKIRHEKSFDYDSAADNDFLSQYFTGYWQSFKYFDTIRTELYNEFTPCCSLSESSFDAISEIGDSNSVGIHIRRGDYVSSRSASSYHGALSLDYYRRALQLCLGSLGDIKLFLFTDDVDWCANNISFGSVNLSFVSLDGSSGDWEDLWVMSHCRHHIIANSSFSWWSAWIADHRFSDKNRFVCAPSNWFASSLISAPDRFPAHWKVC